MTDYYIDDLAEETGTRYAVVPILISTFGMKTNMYSQHSGFAAYWQFYCFLSWYSACSVRKGRTETCGSVL